MGVVKQFCPQSHDTFVVGRTTGRGCKECYHEYRASPHGKEVQAKYQASSGGRAAQAKYRASHQDEIAAYSHRDESLHRRYTYYHAKGYLKRLNCETDKALQKWEAIFGR